MSNTIGITRNHVMQIAAFAAISLAIIFSGYHQKHRFDDIQQVSVQEAKTLVDGGAMIIDVRGVDAYNTRHLAGAISIPLSMMEAGIPAVLSTAKSLNIVIYCNDGVTTGPEATQLLTRAGYTHAVNLRTGIEGWAEAGLPIKK